MTSGRTWVIRLVAVGLVATAAAVGALALRGGEASRAGAEGAQPPAPVVTARIEERSLVSERRYQGEVVAVAEAELTVGEAGRVEALHVEEGDHVEPGEPMLELDDRLARARLGEARASRRSIAVEKEYAERRTDRFEELEQVEAVSPGETEREAVTAESLGARSRAARADIAAMSERVNRHRIAAPFPGVVARIHVDPGDWLDPGEPAIELVTEDRVEVHVRVPADLLDVIEALESVSLHRDDRSVDASLEGIVSALDRATRTALLRLAPTATPTWLRAGGAVAVAFHVRRKGGVVVPRDALVQGIAGVRVVRVVQGKAQPAPVKVLARAGERALVEGDAVEVGDSVVIRGNERLRPGRAVTTEGAMAPPADP